MKRRIEADLNLANQKRIKREKLKIGDQINQQRGNLIFDTFGLEDNINTQERKVMNVHELRVELCKKN